MFKGQSFHPWDSHLHLKVLYLSIYWGLAYLKYRQDTIFANDIFLFTTRQRSFWKVMFSLVSVSLSIQARCPHVTTAYDAIGQSQGTWDSLDICVHLGTLPPPGAASYPQWGMPPSHLPWALVQLLSTWRPPDKFSCSWFSVYWKETIDRTFTPGSLSLDSSSWGLFHLSKQTSIDIWSW